MRVIHGDVVVGVGERFSIVVGVVDSVSVSLFVFRISVRVFVRVSVIVGVVVRESVLRVGGDFVFFSERNH